MKGQAPFFQKDRNEPANCWAEFSINHEFSLLLDDFFKKLLVENPNANLKKPSQHHVSLLYGYKKSESSRLIAIAQQHLSKPISLTVGKVSRGDVSPVILLHINFSEKLNALFWALYKDIGAQKHTLIDGKYDPHITLAISSSESIDTLNVAQYADEFEGKSFTIEHILSYDEDEHGKEILLDEYHVKQLTSSCDM